MLLAVFFLPGGKVTLAKESMDDFVRLGSAHGSAG